MSILHRRRKWRDYADAKYARGDGVCRHSRQDAAVEASSDQQVAVEASKAKQAARKKVAKKKAAKRRR